MPRAIARGSITIVRQEDGFTVNLLPNSLTIPTTAEGAGAVLTDAKTVVSLQKGGASVPLTITSLLPTGCMATFSGSTVTLTVLSADQGEVLVNFKATDNSFTSQAIFTWSKAKQGVSGYTVLLSNEAQTVIADQNGAVAAAAISASTCKVAVYKGVSALTGVAAGATPTLGQFRYVISSVVGGTANRVDNETLVLASITADTVKITLTILCENIATFTKIITITKVRAGSDANITLANQYTDNKTQATLTSAQTYADGVAQSKANVAQANAISAASTDAQAKANAAQAAAATLSQQLVNGVKVGGRNYFKLTTPLSNYKSVLYSRDVSYLRVGGNVANDGYVRLAGVITGNGWYTLSFEAKTENVAWGNNRLNFNQLHQRYYDLTTAWSYHTFSVEITNFDVVYDFIDFSDLSGQAYQFRNIKLEKGNKATDWTPAPEDVQTAIDLAKTTADAANASYTALTASLKSLAYQDVVELAALGSTIITGGKIKTTLLDAYYIRANIVNAGYINTLELVAKTLAADSGTIGGWEVTASSINSIYSGPLENATVTKLKNDGTIELTAFQGGYVYDPVTSSWSSLPVGEFVVNKITPKSISIRANAPVVATFKQMSNSGAVALHAEAPAGSVAARFRGAVEIHDLYFLGNPTDAAQKKNVKLVWSTVTTSLGDFPVLSYIEI